MYRTNNKNGIFSTSGFNKRQESYREKLKLAIIDSSDTWYAQPKQIYDEFVEMGYECLWLARPNHEGAKSTIVPPGYITICIANNVSPIDFATRLPLSLDHPPLERAYKSKADFVFIGDKTTYTRFFSKRPNAFYMPYAVNTDIYKPIIGTDELYDVGFIGNIQIKERKRRIELIKKHFNCFIGNKVFMDKANEFMNSCKIMFNTCDAKEINMRIFEALATGKLLLTDEVDYLDELFEDGIHLVTYSNDNELIDKIGYYLKHEKERKEIAERGRNIVASQHTYRHRAEFIIDKIVESGLLPLHVERNNIKNNISNFFYEEPEKIIPLKDSKSDKLNILLGTNHLFAYTGSEITLLTIANKLKEKGHNITVYAKYVDPNFINVFANIAPVFNNIKDLTSSRFDSAYIQHNIIAIEMRNQYPDLPIVMASLGVLPFLEQPPIVELDIYKYLAISEEVNNNLINKGINKSSIEIFRNIVDSNKFKPLRQINPEPLTAIVYSYKITSDKLHIVQKACEATNIKCHHIGGQPGAIDQNNVAEELNKADIVFTLGRGVIETMMCGKIPIIYDYQGGDGMVTPENIFGLMSHNFSGRRFGKQYNIYEMINEIKKYDHENASKLRELSITLFDADKGVDKLISLLKNASTKTISSTSTARKNEIKNLIELINITKEYSIETYRIANIHRNNTILNTFPEKNRREVKSSPDINTRKIPPLTSIIIPLFNNIKYTKQCLETIIRNTPDELYEVIIVDNASSDGTADFLKVLEGDIKIITNKKNLGFAKACNQGADIAKGDFLLFLNNDTEPQKGWLEPLLLILKNDPKVAAVGSKLLFPNGTIQHAGVIIINDKKLPDPLVARHIYYQQPSDFREANQPRTYQALTAASILIRADAFKNVGGFDEGYWNGYEDVDLCFKLQKEKWKLVYQPQSVVVHHESVSGPERFRAIDNNISRLHEQWIGKIQPDLILNEDGSNTHTTANQIQPYILPVETNSKSSSEKNRHLKTLTSIIVLTYNQLEYTKQCLQSIVNFTSVPYELIIVDNGSTDGTKIFLENFEKVHNGCKIILNDENRGFAGGNNQGIAVATGDHILLLNNDVVVTENWLERLIKHIESDANIGMAGPVSNSVSGPQLVENIGYGNNLIKMNEFAQSHYINNVGKTQDVLRLVGFCMLIKRKVIDIIGGLDEDYGNGNFEDDDLCLRSRIAGFRNIMAQDVFIHHYGSMTFKGNSIDYNASLQNNWKKFIGKWKGVIEVVGDSAYRVIMTDEEQLNKLIDWGEDSFSQGNLHSALKIFERALQFDPKNSQVLNNIGVMQWQLGDPRGAMKTFQNALHNNPKDTDALENLMQATLEIGEFDLIDSGLLEILKNEQPENPRIKTLIMEHQNSSGVG